VDRVAAWDIVIVPVPLLKMVTEFFVVTPVFRTIPPVDRTVIPLLKDDGEDVNVTVRSLFMAISVSKFMSSLLASVMPLRAMLPALESPILMPLEDDSKPNSASVICKPKAISPRDV
jgi:hypothetical protein